MKILKSKKALSPVVASIILIAVTVAVSIAVAAWMGALTIGFMGSSSLTITNVDFVDATPKYVNVTVKNTGTKQVTVVTAKVNQESIDLTSTTLDPGDSGVVIKIPGVTWSAGNAYQIELYDSSGQVVGSTQENAGP